MSSGRLRSERQAKKSGRGPVDARLVVCLAGLLLGRGAALAGELDQTIALATYQACVPAAIASVGIETVDEDGVFADASGQRFFASDLYRPNAAMALESTGYLGGGSGSSTDIEAVPLGPENRWGLVPAWITVRQAGEVQLLQSLLLSEGVALFMPGRAEGACADLLRQAEGEARRNRKGLWEDKAAAPVYSAAKPEPLLERTGDYVIVRGRVVSLGKTDSTRYLNFGKYWKTDFTVTLKTSDEAIFDAALGGSGRHVEALAGKTVELRGVVQEWDGPHIALHHPEQLIVLDPPAFE